MMYQRIEEKLGTAFNPIYMEIVDESYRHNVPKGAESHFKVLLVSDRFAGQRLVSRHRQVYTTLQEELAGSVHALALHLYTPQEWATLEDKQRDSPDCLGGGGAR